MRASAAQIIDPVRAPIAPYGQVRIKHCTRCDDTLLEISRRRRAIRRRAEKRRRCGGTYRDQDHPLEILNFAPKSPTHRPLLLIGGMGPLAGLNGFEMACRQFRGQRRILLIQACDTSCRTTAIINRNAPHSTGIGPQVAVCIAHALIKGAMMIEEPRGEAILLCNTAHYFLPAALNLFLATAVAEETQLRLRSLICAAADEAQQRGHQRVLVLATKGTHIAGLYTEALKRRNITPITPTQEAQTRLEIAIHQGVKGRNDELARHAGHACLLALSEELRNIDGVIAGCTEIPLLLKLILTHAECDPIVDLLHKTEIVDPFASLLKRSL